MESAPLLKIIKPQSRVAIMIATSLFATLLLAVNALAIAISAKPVLERRLPMKLPLTKRYSLVNYNVIEHDQRRVLKSLRRPASPRNQDDSDSGGAIDTSAFSFQGVSYTVAVGVGSPSTSYTLILDSGSSNTWVGAGKSYKKTSTSRQTDNSVTVDYGSGAFRGIEFIDQVSIAKDLIINQSIGVASISTGFTGVDGVLGIGPTDLTIGFLFPDTTASVPTVTDNLFALGAISKNLVAVSFEPFNNSGGTGLNGELSWGGTDSSKFIGDITFVPITSTFPASTFWGIDASVIYGSTVIQPTGAGIVDTGTTTVLLAPQAYEAYMNATGAVFDSSTGFLTITPTQFKQLQGLSFSINGVDFTLNADAQRLPSSLNTAFNGVPNQIYLIVGVMGTDTTEGMDFIIGMAALERFYAVFDTANRRVGLAYTPFTNGTFNTGN